MENNQYFKLFEQWVDSDGLDPCDVDCFAEVKSVVLRCVYEQNRSDLADLHAWLTPLAAKLSLQLKQQGITLAVRQAAEAPLLAAVVRGVLHIMEKDDPRRAVELIRHGAEVLSILLDKDDDIRLDELRDLWPGTAGPPSASTISRALSSLEEAGFVQRTGATKGRRYLVLAKAQRWLEMRRQEESTAFVQGSLPGKKTTVAEQAREANEEPAKKVIGPEQLEIAGDEHALGYCRPVSSQTGDSFRNQVSRMVQ